MKVFITIPESLTEPPETWDHDLLVELACLEVEGEKVALIDNKCLRLGIEDLLGYVIEVEKSSVEPIERILWRPKGVFKEEYLRRVTRETQEKPQHIQNFRDKLPFPEWKHLPLDAYFDNSSLDYNSDTLMIKKRFHFKWRVDGATYSPQRLCRMLTYVNLRRHYDFISFYDDVSVDKRWTQRFLLEMDNQDLTGTFKWGALATVDKISHSDLESLRERQCSYLDYGVIRILDLEDEVKFNQLEAALRDTKKDGITPIITIELDTMMKREVILKVAKMLEAEEAIRRPIVTPFIETLDSYWSYIELLGIAEIIDTADMKNLDNIRDYDWRPVEVTIKKD